MSDDEFYSIPKLPKLFFFMVMLALGTSALLLFIDIKIKNDLVMSAQKWEESINEFTRQFSELGNLSDNPSNGRVRGGVLLDVSSGLEEKDVPRIPDEKSTESPNQQTQRRARSNSPRVSPGNE